MNLINDKFWKIIGWFKKEKKFLVNLFLIILFGLYTLKEEIKNMFFIYPLGLKNID